MNKIISPLRPGMRGTTVADLQDALQLFLEKDVFQSSETEEVYRSLRLTLHSPTTQKGNDHD